MERKKQRCSWAETDPLYIRYHDEEWGVPAHDDKRLFEYLMLEAMQAGLSWLTVLRKRERFRTVFNRFDFHKIARYGPDKIDSLLQDPGIIRNRLKINAVVSNALLFLKIRDEFGSFDKYIWQFMDGKTVTNAWKTLKEIPAQSRESDTMSADLRKRGFKFVGSTICYAFMQATGMVNDHVVDCFRYKDLL